MAHSAAVRTEARKLRILYVVWRVSEGGGAHGSWKSVISDNSCGAFRSDERDVDRTENAPRLLCLRTHSRRDGSNPWTRALGDAADLSQGLWCVSVRFPSYPYLLSDMFHEGSGYDEAILRGDQNVAMMLLADFPDMDSSPPALPDASHRAADRDKEPSHQAPTPPGGCCLRCGGLRVLSYMAHLESDHTGTPMRLWRCVNCGDCVDREILANRGNGSGSARSCARPPTEPQHTGRSRGVGTGLNR
jgi:hypothetical protein